MMAYVTADQALRLLRFCLVGGVFLCINLLMLHVLVDWMGVHYIVACVVAFFALNLLSYLVNKVFTFRLDAKVNRGELLRFYGVMLANLAANLGLMYVLVDMAGLPILLASVAVAALLVPVNFVAHTNWTFVVSRAPETAVHPRQILQVSAFFSAHGGGIEVVAGRLAEGLTARGVPVHWMAGGPPSEQPSGAHSLMATTRAVSIDMLERRLGLPMPLWSFASVAALWRAVKSSRLVQVHDYLYAPSLLAIGIAKVLRRPVVLTQHIGLIPFQSPLSRHLLNGLNRTLGRLVLSRVDQVVFVGKPVQDYFESFVKFKRCARLISNGVDHQRYQAVLNRAARDPARVHFLFVGRFVEKKGLDLLRHCMDLEGCDWTFVGWGALSPKTWSTVLPAHVRLIENARGEDVVRYYQEADMLVLPSRGEGFPLVVQEALACGVPVMVSRDVGAAFSVLDARCVVQVDLGANEPLAELREALQDVIARRTSFFDARPLAVALSQQWSWERCVDEYRLLYEDLLGTRDPVEMAPPR